MAAGLRAGSVALFLLACLAAAPSAQAVDLRIGTATGTLSADPHFTAVPAFYGINSAIFDPLVRLRDKDSVPEPWLAESWRLIDDTTWEFKLRRNVKFHDGSPFTANDVAFSFMRAKTLNASPLPFSANLRKLKEVKVIDDFTAHVITDGPAPALLDMMGLVHMVSHKAAQGTTPQDFNSGKAAIGTGPYKFEAWTANDKLVGVRNPDYWRGPVAFDRVTIVGMPNAATRVAALLSGDIDVADALAPQDVERVKGDSRVKVLETIANRTTFVALDTGTEPLDTGMITGPNGETLDKNPLADPRVREAMKLAIDLKAFVDRIYQGGAEATGQFFMPTAFSFVSEIKPWSPNEERARALLRESGWAGKFKMSIAVPGNYFPNAVASTEAFAQSWTRIGIPTAVNNMPYPVFLERRNIRKLPIYYFAFNITGDKAEIPFAQLFHSRQPDRGYGNANFIRYSNPEVDRLIEAAFGTMDEKALRENQKQAMLKVLDDNVIIPMWFILGATGVRNGFDYALRPDTVLHPANATLVK